jgi:hypothetical protein
MPSITATPTVCTVRFRVFDPSKSDSSDRVSFRQLGFCLEGLLPSSVVDLQQVINAHRGQLTQACLADIAEWGAGQDTEHRGRLGLLLTGNTDCGRLVEIELVDLVLPTVCTVSVTMSRGSKVVKAFELPNVPTETVGYLQRGLKRFRSSLTVPCGELMHAWAVMCCPDIAPTLRGELRGYLNISLMVNAVRVDHTTVFVVEPPKEGEMS